MNHDPSRYWDRLQDGQVALVKSGVMNDAGSILWDAPRQTRMTVVRSVVDRSKVSCLLARDAPGHIFSPTDALSSENDLVLVNGRNVLALMGGMAG